MKPNHNSPLNLHNLILFAEPQDTDGFTDGCNIETFGVGAVMPQDFLDITFLNDSESYGI